MSRYLIKETKVDNGFPGVSISTVTLQNRYYLYNAPQLTTIAKLIILN